MNKRAITACLMVVIVLMALAIAFLTGFGLHAIVDAL